MMIHTVLPRSCATRLRMMCTAAAIFMTIGVLSVPPALAATSRRRHSAHRHLPRCRGAHDRIGSVPRSVIDRATLCLLNHQRTQRGLPKLRGSGSLVRSAQGWTNTMVQNRAFSHGADFGARISAAGFDWSRIGENIADGYRTSSGAVTAWMHSLGHCENILNPDFREVGIGFDDGSALSGDPLRGTWTLDLALGFHQRSHSTDWTPAEGCPYQH